MTKANSLARRMLLYIVLSSALVTLVLTILQLHSEYREDVGGIETSVEQIGKTHTRSIANNLWILNTENLDLQVRDIINLPEIQYAAIRSPEGELLIEHGSRDDEYHLTRNYDLNYTFENRNVYLGQLVVDATLRYTIQRLKKRIVFVLSAQAFKTFLVSSFILLIIYRLVTRPLIALEKHARSSKFAATDGTWSVDFLEKRQDEIGALYRALFEMRDNIKNQAARHMDMQNSAGRALASVGTAVQIRRPTEYNEIVVGCEVPSTLTKLISTCESESDFEAACKEANLQFQKHESSLAMYGDSQDSRVELQFGYKVFLDHNEIWTIISVVVDAEIRTDIYQNITESHRMQSTLLQANKTDALGQLTGGVAHDFNNILGVVLGNTELLSVGIPAGFSTEELNGYVNAIELACDNGSNLTKSLLSFASAAELEATALDLNATVKSTMNWSSRVLPESIDATTVLDSELWSIWADAAMTENALINIVLNARDAMSGGGKLTVETSNLWVDRDYIAKHNESLNSGRYVVLAVTDTGRGITEGHLTKIFDPFFTTKAPGEGSGIGLSAVQGFVKQSGGAVRVFSEVGVGTTVKLFFPAMAKETTSPAVLVQSDVAPTKGARLLLVEDEAALREVLYKILLHAGYDVTLASSGDDALTKIVDLSQIDLVLTDIVMPGKLSGIDLVKTLRLERPDLNVIYMSGYAQESMLHGIRPGTDDIKLRKPVSRISLIRAIETRLEET